MIHQRLSQNGFMVGVHWGRAFRAQLISTIPDMPVVITHRPAGACARVRAVRTPHWLSGFVTAPDVPAAHRVVSPTDARAAANIAEWSSYLPANCVRTMISLGWDRST
jgi:hypothetical protein